MIKVNIVKCLKNIDYHKFNFKEGELYLLIDNLKGKDYVKLYDNIKKDWLCLRSCELYDKDLKDFFAVESTQFFPNKRSLNKFTKIFKDVEAQRAMIKEARERETLIKFMNSKGVV